MGKPTRKELKRAIRLFETQAEARRKRIEQLECKIEELEERVRTLELSHINDPMLPFYPPPRPWMEKPHDPSPWGYGIRTTETSDNTRGD